MQRKLKQKVKEHEATKVLERAAKRTKKAPFWTKNKHTTKENKQNTKTKTNNNNKTKTYKTLIVVFPLQAAGDGAAVEAEEVQQNKTQNKQNKTTQHKKQNTKQTEQVKPKDQEAQVKRKYTRKALILFKCWHVWWWGFVLFDLFLLGQGVGAGAAWAGAGVVGFACCRSCMCEHLFDAAAALSFSQILYAHP